MLFARTEEELLHVNVSQIILEIPMLNVDLNAPQMKNAPQVKHAKICTVWIHVPVLNVVSMHSVKSTITLQTVSVYLDILETPFLSALLSLLEYQW